MLNFIGYKGLKSLLLPYLILAILGSFFFSIDSSYYHSNFSNNIFGANIYAVSTINSVDWEAEDAATIINKNGYRNSYSSNFILRVLTITGIFNTTVHFAKSCFIILKNYYIPITKNQILIKLRI
jgi:hypothetical protein